MEGWTCRRTYEADSKARRVEIWQRDDDNIFRFVECTWMPAGPEDEGALGAGYWSREGGSGMFGDIDACLTEAQRSIPWLGATRYERKPN